MSPVCGALMKGARRPRGLAYRLIHRRRRRVASAKIAGPVRRRIRLVRCAGRRTARVHFLWTASSCRHMLGIPRQTDRAVYRFAADRPGPWSRSAEKDRMAYGGGSPNIRSLSGQPQVED
ncbi:hypothetical protein K523DRAFT_98452 [Schizophyllum commune Tattone D]|nr:hypothetical protein K523DRAFT_98452 [Schizophyllum commune Tattone D]